MNRTIADLNVRIGQKEAKVRQLATKTAELERMERNRPTLPAENQDELRKLDELEEERRKLEQAIVERSKQLSALQSVETRVDLLGDEVTAFNEEIVPLLESAGLSNDAQEFFIALPPGTRGSISRQRQTINAELTELRESGERRSLSGIVGEIKTIKDRSHIARESRDAFEKFQKDVADVAETIRSLNEEIKEIDNVLVPRLEEEEARRLEKYFENFALLEEEKGILEKLYEPLQTALLAGTETDQKLSFVARFSLDVAPFADRGLEVIDRTRKGKYREEGALEAGLKRFWAALEDEGFKREVIQEKIVEFRQTFQEDETGSPLLIAEQLRKGNVPPRLEMEKAFNR